MNIDLQRIMSEVFECDIEDITQDAEVNLVSGWDSLNHIKLIMTLNQNGIDIPHAMIPDLTSFKALQGFIDENA